MRRSNHANSNELTSIDALSKLQSPTPLKTERQREIFSYLCHNDGPDDEHRAHPKNKKVDYDDLYPALKAAKGLGFCSGIKLYHFQTVRGLWKEQQWLDEIILKRVDTLLYGRYGGDFLKFCASVQAKDLLQPLEEVVGGRDYKISVLQPLGTIYNSSPFQIAMRYLEITNQKDRYNDLRPYHFSNASQGTYHDKATALEVVSKKIKYLLRHIYHYDFARLCATINREEFLAPFSDRVNGKPMLVKMGVAAKAYDECLYSMLTAYIKSEGLTRQFKGFRPYHMSTASQATYRNPDSVKEVIVKSCKYQIATTYGGDAAEFIARGTLPEIEAPFYEVIAGRRFWVTAQSAVRQFGESSKKIKRLYMRERNNIRFHSTYPIAFLPTNPAIKPQLAFQREYSWDIFSP